MLHVCARALCVCVCVFTGRERERERESDEIWNSSEYTFSARHGGEQTSEKSFCVAFGTKPGLGLKSAFGGVITVVAMLGRVGRFCSR
jgi:hypothetical protein